MYDDPQMPPSTLGAIAGRAQGRDAAAASAAESKRWARQWALAAITDALRSGCCELNDLQDAIRTVRAHLDGPPQD